MRQKPEFKRQKQLNQLPKEELVKLIMAQQEIIEQLKVKIEKRHW